jgi:hypothetical protein
MCVGSCASHTFSNFCKPCIQCRLNRFIAYLLSKTYKHLYGFVFVTKYEALYKVNYTWKQISGGGGGWEY